MIVPGSVYRSLLNLTIPLQLVFLEELFPFVPPYQYERLKKPQETPDNVVGSSGIGNCIDLLNAFGHDSGSESKSGAGARLNPGVNSKPESKPESGPSKALVLASAIFAGLVYAGCGHIDNYMHRYLAGGVQGKATRGPESSL